MIARLRLLWAKVARASGVGIGMCLLGAAALVSSTGWLVTTVQSGNQIDNLEHQLDCRFELSTEVSRLESERNAAFATGLAAFARDDEAGVEEQAAVIDDINAALGPALDRRSDGVERCKSEQP